MRTSRRRVVGALYEPIEPPAPQVEVAPPAPQQLPQLPPLSIWALLGPLAPIGVFCLTLRYTHNVNAATLVAVVLLVCVVAVGSKK